MLKDKPLHIAIDGNEANTLSRVGSNVYAYQVLKAIESETAHTNTIVTVLLAQPPVQDLPKKRAGWNYLVINPKQFWTQWALPIHLQTHKNSYSAFFTPGHYAPRLCPIPYISTVMDTAYLPYPEQFKKSDTHKLTSWTKYSVKHAHKVLTISEFTKSEVLKYYQKSESDVFVGYPGTTPTNHTISDTFRKKTLRKFKIKQPFILYVGTLQPRKNLATLVKAFGLFSRMLASRSLTKKTSKKSHSAAVSPQLVIAGRVGWLAQSLLESIKKSPLSERIITTGFVSDTEKQVLYEEAFVSTLLGLYEGFGIPPLESFYYGTPVVAANTSSLPEVIGDAGLLVPATNASAIAEAFYTVFTASAQQKLIWKRRGIKQTKQFSWDSTAQTILSELQQLADVTTNEKVHGK